MVFNVSIGFANVPTSDGKTKYSIWLADTAQVRPLGELPLVLTADMDRKYKSIHYELSDDPAPTPSKTETKPKAPPTKRSDAAKSPIKASDTSGQSADRKKKTNNESVVLRDRLRSRNKVSTVEESEKLLERQNVRIKYLNN